MDKLLENVLPNKKDVKVEIDDNFVRVMIGGERDVAIKKEHMLNALVELDKIFNIEGMDKDIRIHAFSLIIAQLLVNFTSQVMVNVFMNTLIQSSKTFFDERIDTVLQEAKKGVEQYMQSKKL